MSGSPRFAELIERHERELFRYAYRLVRDAEDAADVLQESFMRAFRAFGRLPRDANHRAWLFRITSRQALNLLRSRRTRPTEPMVDPGALRDPVATAEESHEQARVARLLDATVAALPSRQRAALLLRKYEGLSYAEVAAALGTNETNARAHVSHAMRRVKRALSAEGATR